MGYYTADYPLVVDYYSNGYAFWHNIGEVKQHRSKLYTDEYNQMYFKYNNSRVYSRKAYTTPVQGMNTGIVYELYVRNGNAIVSVETGNSLPLNPEYSYLQLNH